MRFFATLALLFSTVLPFQTQSTPAPTGPLTVSERRIAATADVQAAASPARALQWLDRQRRVQRAVLASDGETIFITFQGGHTAAILPRTFAATAQVGGLMRPSATWRPLFHQDQTVGASSKAIVLEPFQDELGLGTQAGQAEVEVLKQAGFSVDFKANADVTVGVMQNLSQYSVVYVETHSGVLPDGGAIILTDETDAGPYKSFFDDGSVTQGLAAGDPNHLYIAITPKFISLHMGTFPNGAMLFLNGCSVLGSPGLWSALQSKNVASLISWDNEAYSFSNEVAASLLFSSLQTGLTIAGAVQSVGATPYGTSVVNGVTAHLGYLGYGGDTLADMLARAAIPTATATAAPTATDAPATSTPIPTPAPKATAHKKHKKHKKRTPCKPGHHRVHGKCVKTKHK